MQNARISVAGRMPGACVGVGDAIGSSVSMIVGTAVATVDGVAVSAWVGVADCTVVIAGVVPSGDAVVVTVTIRGFAFWSRKCTLSLSDFPVTG